MSDHIKVANESGLVREASSRAILVTDMDAAAAWQRKRQKQLAQQEQIDSLRSEVGELKTLMQAILEKLNNG